MVSYTDRPWEPLGIDTRGWLMIRPKAVSIAVIVPTQRYSEDYIAEKLGGGSWSYCGDPLIHLVKWGGLLYLNDGHHRLELQRRGGLDVVWARILMPARHPTRRR